MRAVELNLVSTDENKVGFEVTVERNVAGTWRSDTPPDHIENGEPEAQRRILLDSDQRIIITAAGADVEMVLDPVNKAVMPRAAFESQPTEAERQEMEDKRQEELRRGSRREARATAKAEEAANIERVRVLEQQRQQDAEKAKVEAEKNKQAQEPPPASATPSQQPTAPKPAAQPARPGGMTAPAPATGGQSSKDVK